MKFSDFDLNKNILKQLEIKGYKEPTPIQEKSIAPLIEGKDLLGIAQTGTGKTAAFALPLINTLIKTKKRLFPNQVRSLILTPTRELASQIDANFQEYAKGQGLRSRVVFGGVGKMPQINALKGGLDLLVATPGRLLDLMSENHADFSSLEVFILDEADTMLDMGFLKDVKRVIKELPSRRQTLLFSATMPKDIEKLAKELLRSPIKVEVTPESTTVEKIDQKVMYTAKENKMYLLFKILEDVEIKSVLVFTKTKYNADRVVKHLERVPITSAAIHSNKSQNAREKALGDFKSGKVRVLVGTDIAARGIDVKGIDCVINFNLPEDPKNYVHRIGRTARAGKSGQALSLCAGAEYSLLKNIEKAIKQKIPLDTDHPFHEDITKSEAASPAKKIAKKSARGSRGNRRR